MPWSNFLFFFFAFIAGALYGWKLCFKSLCHHGRACTECKNHSKQVDRVTVSVCSPSAFGLKCRRGPSISEWIFPLSFSPLLPPIWEYWWEQWRGHCWLFSLPSTKKVWPASCSAPALSQSSVCISFHPSGNYPPPRFWSLVSSAAMWYWQRWEVWLGAIWEPLEFIWNKVSDCTQNKVISFLFIFLLSVVISVFSSLNLGGQIGGQWKLEVNCKLNHFLCAYVDLTYGK